MTYDPRTCTQRQDAALEELFRVVTRLDADMQTLRERVTALEADNQADVRFVLLEPVPEDHTATANQTFTWLPGDAWSQYCAAVDGDAAAA
jgi:hypothetical protein